LWLKSSRQIANYFVSALNGGIAGLNTID